MVGCKFNPNLAELQRAADDAVKTPEAMREAQILLEEYIKSGGIGSLVSKTGHKIPTLRMMKDIANKFIDILSDVVGSYPSGSLYYTMPESIARYLYNARIMGPEKRGNTFVFKIDIPGNLHRESLYPAGYPDGVDNIVRLFDEGYTAKHMAFKKMPNGMTKYSLTHRNALNFMQSAADAFNSSLGQEWGAKVSIQWENLD